MIWEQGIAIIAMVTAEEVSTESGFSQKFCSVFVIICEWKRIFAPTGPAIKDKFLVTDLPCPWRKDVNLKTLSAGKLVYSLRNHNTVVVHNRGERQFL